jgi:hypothetical protein
MDRAETFNKDVQVDYLSDYLRIMRGCGLLMEISARESADLQMDTVASNMLMLAISWDIIPGTCCPLDVLN